MNKKVKNGIGILEMCILLVWLGIVGIGGYFLGLKPDNVNCPMPNEIPTRVIKQGLTTTTSPPIRIKKPCPIFNASRIDRIAENIKCAKAELPNLHEKLVNIPREMLAKTKWDTIMTFSPRQFFDKYLTQYPADTMSHQPVIVFSHKPLISFDDLSTACSVMDVVVIPDSEDACVAVTETFHDVSSYHMLHAERRKTDGKFIWHPNNMALRVVPSEEHYVAARQLFVDFFDASAYILSTMYGLVPKFTGVRAAVGVVIETAEEAQLFENSLASATKVGIQKNKFVVFTTDKNVQVVLARSSVKIVYLANLSKKFRSPSVDEKLRTEFLRAVVAYLCANTGYRMIWQSPGSVWLDRPDNILTSVPDVETLWSYTGTGDIKAAPYYASFDFVGVDFKDRPVHLMHELILNFELAIAWNSFDAMVSYRLSENNARYGTTMIMLSPLQVLHTKMIDNDPVSVLDALSQPTPPMVVVLDSSLPFEDAKKLLIQSKLWFMN